MCSILRNTDAISPMAWNGYFAYMRKRFCYDTALANEDPNDPYDFFVLARPDLVYFEPLPSVLELALRPHRVYLGPKECCDLPLSDFFYIIPRRWAKEVFDLMRDMYSERCVAQR